MVSLAYIGANWFATQAAWVPYAINTKVIPSVENGLGPKPDIPTAQLIASPAPIWSFERELILGEHNNYFVIPPGETPSPWNAKPIARQRCDWPDVEELRKADSQLDAFLFWSRAPFATRAEDGSVVLHDARFYDPRARANFSVRLPDVECEELPAE